MDKSDYYDIETRWSDKLAAEEYVLFVKNQHGSIRREVARGDEEWAGRIAEHYKIEIEKQNANKETV